MAPSFDCAVSSFLCEEDKNSLFNNYDNDDGDFDNQNHHHHHPQDLSSEHGEDFMFEFCPVQSDVCLDLMIEKEKQHLVGDDYLKRLRCGDLDLGARREIIDWIGKVNSYFNFGPLCAYLSINYMDRFLSAYELPKGKAWMMQLLGVTCLSLAAKMEETEVPLSLDLQVGESKYVFEARTIQRMELLVLGTLKWRMQVLTPFSYLDYFISKITDDQISQRSLILLSVQVILSTIREIDFLEFKPSEIAAAVAISVAGENLTVDIDNAFSVLNQLVQKERVVKCVELIEDLSLISGSKTIAKTRKGEENDLIPSSSRIPPKSPIGVLDAATTLSYKTDDYPVFVGSSCAISSTESHYINSPDSKRRKLNRPCDFEL